MFRVSLALYIKKEILLSFVERLISSHWHRKERGDEAVISGFRVLFQLINKKITVTCYYVIIICLMVTFIILHNHHIIAM